MNNTDDPIVFPFGYKISKTCPTMKVKIKVTKEYINAILTRCAS